MSERLPLPVEILRGIRPLPAEVDAQTHNAVHRLLDLADRGDYLTAAEEAAELLRGPVNDARLIAIYLMGDFVERGVTSLPELLARVEDLLGPERATTPRAARRLESAVTWLTRSVADRIAFHTQRRDETWQAWIEAVSEAEVSEIVARSERLSTSSTGGATLTRLARWARDKLGPASARVRRDKPAPVEPVPATPILDPEPSPDGPRWDEAADDDEPEPEPEPEPEYASDEPDDFDPDDFDPDDFDPNDFDSQPRGFEHSRGFARLEVDTAGFDLATRAPSRPPSTGPADLDSPALMQLRQKIHGFEILLTRGDYDKAALIARDIQAALDDFDPILYLPKLFARYLKLLSRSLAEIEQHWAAEDSTARRVLEQLYRADLDGFIDD